MCAKFEVKAAMKKVKKRFGLKLNPPCAQGVEMNPTARILTIDGQSGHARGRLLGWGLKLDWDPKPLINARAETLSTKTTFRPLLARRCLVPATAYFEWARPPGGAKQKMRIHPKKADLFAMAGLIGEDGDTFTIVTCAPAPEIAALHTRMPVILPPEAEVEWLNPNVSFDAVAQFLQPYKGAMEAQNVDERPVLF